MKMAQKRATNPFVIFATLFARCVGYAHLVPDMYDVLVGPENWVSRFCYFNTKSLAENLGITSPCSRHIWDREINRRLGT